MGEEAATEQGRPVLHFYEARSLARLACSRHIRSRLASASMLFKLAAAANGVF